MKKITGLIIALMLFYSGFCQDLADLSFGEEGYLEIMTWNLEWFPKRGQATVDSVSQIISALDVDLIAFQEISEFLFFESLTTSLEGYEGYYVNSEYSGLAYIYKEEVIQVNNIYEIFTTPYYWRPFPRAPLIMDMTYNEQTYYVIDNHLKAMGDGIMDPEDPWDEETRRFDACNFLHEYIMENLPDEKVILLGDLNDILTDSPANNVFTTFLEDEDNFLFADMDIANGSSNGWSYPSWPSHLDHILVSNEIFSDLQSPDTSIQTLEIDDYIDGGWSSYDYYISDHRPIALKFISTTDNYQNEINPSGLEVNNYPNPASAFTTFQFDLPRFSDSTQINIYNLKGQIVTTLHVQSNTRKTWNCCNSNGERLSSGIYFYSLETEHYRSSFYKLMIINAD